MIKLQIFLGQIMGLNSLPKGKALLIRKINIVGENRNGSFSRTSVHFW